ncbi:hypothetical protein U1Q18_043157 [Sarracenia purpurea var. burkii]
MSEVGRHESFLWESQSWAFSNSDNSGGSSDKSGVKLPDSGSNTQTPTGKEVVAPPIRKNQSGVSKNGKGGGDHVNEGKGGGGGGGGESSDHEIHIWTERERRKKMRNMFSNLHALLPQLPPKADKSTIVDEAVNYIKSLQHTLQKLQRQKLERLHGAASLNYGPSSSITQQKLTMTDSMEAFMADQVSSSNFAAINAPPSRTSSSATAAAARFPPEFQTWTSQNVILNVCGDQAQISVCSPKKPGLFAAVCCVLEKHRIEVVCAHVSSDQNRTTFMIQAHARIGADELPEAFPVEELYKQAAGEIMLWVSS